MKIQPVRGTRDFYPQDLAFCQWIMDAWRRLSRRAGFAEVDGPELEPLELYTDKSGEEIAEQLYAFEDKGGRRLALRPEFTPTLARMIAARQASLPEPIRWFNIARCFRYERAQKGRLREFFQWNVDLVGVEGEVADAECIAVAADALAELGLQPQDVEVRISDRRLLGAILTHLGIPEAAVPHVLAVLDKRGRLPPEAVAEMLGAAGLTPPQREALDRILAWRDLADIDPKDQADPAVRAAVESVRRLFECLGHYGIAEWCRFDIGIVRGLAYYTGPVWEVHDRKGEFRAVFGGGRYDRLLGDLGAQPMPACGFGCGDAVLGLLLKERGLAPPVGPAAAYYVAAAGGPRWPEVLAAVRRLRQRGHATLFDPKGGSLKRQLKKAADAGARYVVIVGDERAAGRDVLLRDMQSGEQRPVPLDALGA
jgi:histidyl-tRNA synthetase